MTDAEREVADLCRDLLRIDTSNYGDRPGPGERVAADYVAQSLSDVGLDPQVYESEPGRASVVVRVPGEDRERGALLVHGHLDVVPADAGDWAVDPFAGELREGYLWGRGAVDMKDMDAMTLAVVREMVRSGRRPPRDLVLAFLADEEAGGMKGAGFLTREHPGLFDGVTEAIGEVGGFSCTVGEDRRLYLLQTAEKSIGWLRLTARGRAGHGSMLNDDNAVTALAEALSRLGRHDFPLRETATVRQFLDGLGGALGHEIGEEDVEAAVAKLGPVARFVAATLRNTVNPTMLEAGYKVNVIPQVATAYVDTRALPGYEEELEQTLDTVLGPGIAREYVHRDIALETTFDGELVDAMTASLAAEDPQGVAVPYMLSGGTDAKHFARLGVRCFGFAPLRLPPDLDFAGLFHGVDERVPVESLQFGVRVLRRFLATC